MDPIQGGVSHNDRRGGSFWHKAGGILGNIGEAVLDVAVPIGAAMASSFTRPVAGGTFNNVDYDDYWESDSYPSPVQLDAQFQQEETNRRRRWDNVINQPSTPLLTTPHVLNRPSKPLPEFNQPLPQTNLQGWVNRQQKFWNNQNTQPQEPQQEPIELASNTNSLSPLQGLINPQPKQRELIQEQPIDNPLPPNKPTA